MRGPRIVAVLLFISWFHADAHLLRDHRLPKRRFVPTFNEEQQQYVNAHNNLRKKVGVPPLQWDAGLTAFAQSWAEERQADCNYRNHSKGPYGENTIWMMDYKQVSPAQVVEKWFSEQRFFDHTRNVCKCKVQGQGCQCGHYLNVIWKTTKRVGCSGYVMCDADLGFLIVCSYDPRGNYKGMNPLNPRKL